MARRLTILLFIFIFSLVLFPPRAFAATCNLITNPAIVTTNQKNIDVTVVASGLVSGKDYRVKINDKEIETFVTDPVTGAIMRLPAFFPAVADGPNRQLITIAGLSPEGSISTSLRSFEEKPYVVTILDKTSPNIECASTFVVTQSTVSLCEINFVNSSFTPDDDITIQVKNLSPTVANTHVYLRKNGERGPDAGNWCLPAGGLGSVALGKHEVGDYFVEIKDASSIPVLCQAGQFETRQCSKKLTISLSSPGGPGGGGAGSLGSACENRGTSANPNYVCRTALGDIDTNPNQFVKKLFTIILSLSGGIALLLIIVSGYSFMASQGNPEKVQGAKETLTSAIVGLLFIIFSLVILQVIGVDILRIPGFQ